MTVRKLTSYIVLTNARRGTNEPLHALLQPLLHTIPLSPPADTLRITPTWNSPRPVPPSHPHPWAVAGCVLAMNATLLLSASHRAPRSDPSSLMQPFQMALPLWCLSRHLSTY